MNLRPPEIDPFYIGRITIQNVKENITDDRRTFVQILPGECVSEVGPQLWEILADTVPVPWRIPVSTRVTDLTCKSPPPTIGRLSKEISLLLLCDVGRGDIGLDSHPGK